MIAYMTVATPMRPGYWKPSITDECFYDIDANFNGTYNTLAARLFGLTYPNYLRYIRDVYHAELMGRKGGYIYYIFKEKTNCDKLVKELNRRWKIWEKGINIECIG